MEVQETKALREASASAPALPHSQTSDREESPHKDVTINPLGREEHKEAFGEDRNKEKFSGILKELNVALEVSNVALRYSVDKQTKDIVIRVVELPSEKLIRQIPPEELLRIRGHLQELLGVIFDKNG